MNKVLFILLLTIGFIVLCIRYIETWGIFFPKKEIEVYPSALNLPFALVNKLYKAASGPKEIIELTGSHNTAFLDSKEKYVSSISLFIEKL